MVTEDMQEVIDDFLEEYEGRNIFVYGLGIKTKNLLDILTTERVSGVVSDIRIGEEIYGLEIVDVNSLKDGDILILACYIGSLKIVYDRVKYIEERGIEIVDLSLTNLTEYKNIKYKVNINKEINVEEEVKLTSNVVIDFENVISQVVNSKIIYRQYFLDLINNCCEQGKVVYVRIDDTFDSEDFEKIGLLDKVKIIDENQDISNLMSETTTVYFTNKTNVDTYNCNIINVNTTMELLNNSNLKYLADDVRTDGDEIILKLIANRLFYNPFSSDISIKSLEDLGYIVFAPITAKFFEFMIKSNLDKDGVILFVSRDGYLINELYEKYKDIYSNLPDNRYTYVSRRSATVTSIKSEDDIRAIVNREFMYVIGNFRDKLEQKIGFNLVEAKKLDVDTRTITTDEQKEELVEAVLEYKDLILQNAEKERNAYLKYLDNLDVNKYSKKYIYDLYTFGTIFSKLEQHFDDVSLLCFSYGKDKRLEGKQIISMLGENSDFYFKIFLKIFPIFEIIYAPEDGQFDKIDENGNPIFRPGTEYNYDKISQIQRGITDFIDDFLEIGKDCEISVEYVDSILKLLNRSMISDDVIGNAFELENKFGAEDVKNMWDELTF